MRRRRAELFGYVVRWLLFCRKPTLVCLSDNLTVPDLTTNTRMMFAKPTVKLLRQGFWLWPYPPDEHRRVRRSGDLQPCRRADDSSSFSSAFATGKWIRARYLAERHELEQRYAEWEIICEPEVRHVHDDTLTLTASHVARSPSNS
jgi:hypothetical protein